MRQLAENLFVVDGPNVPFMGCAFSTRMTVIRLSDARLWIHSPIPLNTALKQWLAGLGDVTYLIAPNHLHHLFVAQWQRVYPSARSYAPQQLLKKRADLCFDGVLDNHTAMPWQDEIAQRLFTGSPLMEECIFMHVPSSSLIVTDLIENFAPDHFSPCQRLFAKCVGILAPQGKMPLDWRLSFVFSKSEARAHLAVMLAWHPERIIMAHGVLVERDSEAFLRRAFRWLAC